jgi:hypothetical protein
MGTAVAFARPTLKILSQPFWEKQLDDANALPEWLA